MHGIAIVTGINASGKGEVCRILSLQIEGARHINLSQLMKMLGKLNSHHSLGQMGENERNQLRNFALEKVRDEGAQSPVLLDTHFIFENGEIPDLSLIRSRTAAVISVGCKPKTILERLSRDAELDDRPARILLYSAPIDEIRRYAEADLYQAQKFTNEQNTKRIPLLEFSNNFPKIDELWTSLREFVPKIESAFAYYNRTIEGNFMSHQSRK